MRTSRVAKETSKFFKHDSAGSLPQRRPTRSSTRLARFAYTNGESSTSIVKDEDDSQEEDILGFGSDIEDAIITKSSKSSMSPPPSKTRAAKAVITGKRKRTTTTTSTTAPPSRKTRTTVVKQEPGTKPELESDEEKKPPAPETKPKRTRIPARKTTNPSTGEVKVEPPSDWEEMYALVKEMRISGPAANAAVDTMGCERLASPEASPRDRRFHTLVALMLSSQTKDTVNAEAMIRLKKELPPYEEGKEKGLNLENMLAVEPGVLNELIGKVGFHNNKTKYLKQAAVICRDQHNSDIPNTLEGLMSIPGVGPKMAHLCMGAEHGWNKVTGIGVDVHVHRITNLWGWQMPPSKNPEETRMALESWLPRDKWKEINWLLVGFGQKVCLPVGRKCGECTLGLKGLCKAAERGKVLEGRRRLEMEVKIERVAKEEVKVEGGDVKIVKKEEEEGKVIVKEDWLVERTRPVNGSEIKKSIEEDDDELSFVKRQVKEETADDQRGVEKSEVKDEDSLFVKIKDESDEEMS